MKSCQCEGIAAEFDDDYAAEKLELYRQSGPDPTTHALVEAIRAEADIEGMTLLDIGGGVGVVQHELLEAGLSSAVEVEASEAYAAANRGEADRQGHADRITHIAGDFSSVAGDIEPADIVTLDRSVCCWHDMPGLVSRSAEKTRHLYGLVYPRDVWWVRYGWRVFGNARHMIRRNPMRAYIHRTREVEAILEGKGLTRRSYREMGVWQVVVFART